MKKTVTKIDHNFHLQKNSKFEEWEKRKGENYLNYRKQWYNNPTNNILDQFPIHLDIEATTACNFECTMCYRTELVRKNKYWKIENFNIEKYKKIIDEGVKKGLKSVKYQFFGEPMINKKIYEMIKYAKDAGVVDTMFNTNASLLTTENAKKLINSGIDKVFFSFDSPYREKFNKIRVKGDYDQVLDNIKNFMQIKKEMKSDNPITRVQMVLMKETKKDWEDFKKLFEPIVDTIAYVDYLDHGDQNSHNTKGVINIQKNQKPYKCPQLWQRSFIHPDGVVTPCCIDTDRVLVMGNINNESIDKIWRGKKYNELRSLHNNGKFSEIPLCSKCPLANS